MGRTWVGMAAVSMAAAGVLGFVLSTRDADGEGGGAAAADRVRQAADRIEGSGAAPEPSEHGGATPDARGRSRSAATLQAMNAWERRYLSVIRQHLEMRAQAGDAHAQLTLALMNLEPAGSLSDPAAIERQDEAGRARRGLALARALEMAPDDPLVAWYVADSCGYRHIECDKQAAWRRLQALDPDNAAVWLTGLDVLLESGDVEGLELRLSLFVEAERFDNPVAATGRLLVEQIDGVAMPEVDPDLREAMGERLGLGRPLTDEELRYMPATNAWIGQAGAVRVTGPYRACLGAPTLADPAICRRAAARLSTGSSLIERVMGLVLQVQLTADLPEGARWREALRRHHWQYEQYMALAREAPPPGYLRRVLVDGEIDALEWRLARAGISEPPPGWLPTRPRQRALVTTGRLPPGD